MLGDEDEGGDGKREAPPLVEDSCLSAGANDSSQPSGLNLADGSTVFADRGFRGLAESRREELS